MSELFFQSLPNVERFTDVSNYHSFEPVPDNWFVVVADVRGSTEAVEKGQYKDVNMVGASAIIAVLNMNRKLLIPFVFGGDGATLLVPPIFESDCRAQLPGLITLAENAFGLNLCVGLVPVAVVRDAGFDVRVLKYAASEDYYQAMILGGGVSYAEQLVKNEQAGKPFRLTVEHQNSEVNLQGLECRWQDIHSEQGEVVNLLVQVINCDPENSLQVYQDVLSVIRDIFGTTAFMPNLQTESLHLSLKRSVLKKEAVVTTQSAWSAWWKAWYLLGANVLGRLLLRFSAKWQGYQDRLVETSDYKKFDDMLRMVLSGSEQQRQQLQQRLAQLYAKGNIVYGLHVSDRALMTCLVMDRFGQQVHFLDGADGGYTRAATMMKQQLMRFRQNLSWV